MGLASADLETRRELLRDSAALNRLLAAVIRAHMLDEEERLENLLGQVSPGAVERVAALLAAEANDQQRPAGPTPRHSELPLREPALVVALSPDRRRGKPLGSAEGSGRSR